MTHDTIFCRPEHDPEMLDFKREGLVYWQPIHLWNPDGGVWKLTPQGIAFFNRSAA